MNEKIEMKKKLLKQALSKNQSKKDEPMNQRVVGKIIQRKTIQEKPISSSKTLQVNYKRRIQEFVPKQKPMRIEEELSSMNQDNSMCTQSDNFSQKPSYRSSFSESLYTQETDNVKSIISKVFEKKSFMQDVQSSLEGRVKLKGRQEIIDIKPKLLANEVFVLSLEARLRQRKGRERQDLVEREIKKKVISQILLNQNQKDCYNAEIRIQNFLQDKLKRIKRKEY